MKVMGQHSGRYRNTIETLHALDSHDVAPKVRCYRFCMDPFSRSDTYIYIWDFQAIKITNIIQQETTGAGWGRGSSPLCPSIAFSVLAGGEGNGGATKALMTPAQGCLWPPNSTFEYHCSEYTSLMLGTQLQVVDYRFAFLYTHALWRKCFLQFSF